MAQRGPLVTAIVAVGGLVGLMTANAAGGLVTASGPSPTPTPAGATQSEQPTTSEAPVETTTAPPPPAETTETTTAPPAPPSPQFPAEVVYTGRADGSPTAIAVAVKGDESAAYLCDGKNLELWLRGTAKDGKVDLKSADGASTLTAQLNAESLLAGTISLAGAPLNFAIPVGPPPAGLYRGQNGETSVGWIIMPNGQQVGIASSGSTKKPAPMLDPAKGGATVDGKFVPAEKVTGES